MYVLYICIIIIRAVIVYSSSIVIYILYIVRDIQYNSIIVCIVVVILCYLYTL